jgi:H+/Cl- antiporter ClcA
MHPKHSFHQYPRPDNVYTHKSSLNFDMMRAKIFENRKGVHMDFYVWVAHVILGFTTGAIAWFLSTFEDFFVEKRREWLQDLLNDNADSVVPSWLFYTAFGTGLVLIATLLTIYVGPGANGSGIAEIMGLLNGVNYPNAIGFRTLFVKVFGTLFAVSGGLCIGKEGPLAHIGSNVGVITCWLPIKAMKCL